MRLPLVVIGVLTSGTLGLSGCGSSASAPARIDITGQWTLDLAYSNAQRGVSCSAQRMLVGFTQADTSFSGVVVSGFEVCSGPLSTTTTLVGQRWTSGQINGVSLTSRAGSCTVAGTVSGTPANAMSGIVTCSEAISGGVGTLTGSWSGTKQ